MNEDFVTYELAVKLKEKRYPQDDLVRYNEDGNMYLDDFPNAGYCAPTISQALKWLREEKKLHVEVMYIRPLHGVTKYYITDIDGDRGNFMDVSDEHYENYEQAALAGIEYCLDNLI